MATVYTPQAATAANTTQATYWLLAEASDLGFAPGSWPLLVETTLGNGRAFERRRRDGYHVVYRQPGTAIELYVLND